jgi:MoxR-like ATPase
LSGEDGILFARDGFNIIATSNTLDQGVHEMSAALKRRMNFETIQPIQDIRDETDVVMREANRMIQLSGVAVKIAPEIVEVLVTIFHELRNGQTLDGRSTDRLAAAVMSTAEAVSVIHAMGVHAYYYSQGKMTASDLVHFLIGASLKDNREDRRRLKHYFETELALRKGALWQAVYQHRHLL